MVFLLRDETIRSVASNTWALDRDDRKLFLAHRLTQLRSLTAENTSPKQLRKKLHENGRGSWWELFLPCFVPRRWTHTLQSNTPTCYYPRLRNPQRRFVSTEVRYCLRDRVEQMRWRLREKREVHEEYSDRNQADLVLVSPKSFTKTNWLNLIYFLKENARISYLVSRLPRNTPRVIAAGREREFSNVMLHPHRIGNSSLNALKPPFRTQIFVSVDSPRQIIRGLRSNKEDNIKYLVSVFSIAFPKRLPWR